MQLREASPLMLSATVDMETELLEVLRVMNETAEGVRSEPVTDEEVERARQQPPHDTRAYFRGECVRRYPESIAAASWDSVVFDIPQRESLLRVPTLEPTRGTHGHVSHILDASPDAASLIDALTDD